jgi:hypothetical protein
MSGFFILRHQIEIFTFEGVMRANLKATIEARFGSQIAFAREVHLHPIKINRLCRGWIEPTALERARITEALQTDPDWLFTVLLIPAPKNILPEPIAP